MTLEELTTLEKLNEAFYKSSKISHWKESTQRYKIHLLDNNIKLQEELRNGTYRMSETIKFTICERGKLRHIEAPIMRDRIVQKVLCTYILVPALTKSLIYDNYASLKNRGTSFARKRTDVLLNRYVQGHGSNGYILQIDIEKYFDNIDHDILKEMVHKEIHEEKRIMDLIDYIIDTSSTTNKGLNLGSEAPQIFAIFYLSKIDQYIKTVCGEKYYGRYMDDSLIVHEDKEHLEMLLDEIIYRLDRDLKLHVNKSKTHITKLSKGFTFLQIKYNIDGNKIIKRPTRAKIVRERIRLKKYKKLYLEGKMTELDIHNNYRSWRNAVVKDCNHATRSIMEMDKLYEELFPNHEEYKKNTREEIIFSSLQDILDIDNLDPIFTMY